MTQAQQGQSTFCGLTLKMYSTGKKTPKMEYQASSNKAQFQCTLTKNMFDLTNIQGWLNTPQVQEYVRSGHVLKWGAKTTQSEANKYSDGMGLEVTYYMVKPFSKAGYNPQPIAQPMQQVTQGVQLTDDKLPQSEVDWAKELPTDFNPDMYEQELG